MSVAVEWNNLVVVPLASIVLNLIVFGLISRNSSSWAVSRIFLLMVLAAIGWSVGDTFVTLTPRALAHDTDPFWGRVMWSSGANPFSKAVR